MKKLLFIAHEYHQKTRSFEFLAKLLSSHYDLEFVFLSPLNAEGDTHLATFANSHFDVVVCFQMPPPLKALEKLECDHVVFFPMFDHSGRWGIEEWMPYRGFRIISFSKTMADQLQHWGFDAFYFQFFPDPGPVPPAGAPDKAFFWTRTDKINIRTFMTLLSDSELRSLHLHKVLDPGNHEFSITPAEEARFETHVSTWFKTKQEMLEKIQECAVYFAPRMYEGIGHSFLEAMAMGRCVIAPDRPTMNEYIIHGKTGLLYNPKRPIPLSIGDITRIQHQTREYMVEGHARWKETSQLIIPLLESATKASYLKPIAHLILRYLTHPISASKKSRQRLFSIRIKKGEWKVRFLGWSWANRSGH